jgi:anti-anti-sigma regulatory factor|tara:strand:+ start:696 stop:1001 length:306 start_codon:yes stop_codon:yes gene_type:complete
MPLDVVVKNGVMLVSGRLVGRELVRVRDAGKALLNQSDQGIIVDLSQTESVIDIAGIQVLAAFSRSARIRGKQFRLIGLNKIQIDALKLAGFESLTDSTSD